MKKSLILTSSIFLLLLLIANAFAYQGNNMGVQGKNYGKNQGGQTYTLYDDTQVNHQAQIDMYPTESLTQEEINGLLLMREEEKLARDVYLELYDIFGQQIFSNIAKSESTHTEAIKSLLDKYELEDPMQNDERGVFQNKDLENLYNSLVEQGSVSLIEALKVGATIEDLDIKDLQELNQITDNQDISAVYDNLEKGSRNHLRSFTSLIEKNGETYEPQYITEEYFNSIISTNIESGLQYSSNNNMRQNANEIILKENPQGKFSKAWSSFKSWFN